MDGFLENPLTAMLFGSVNHRPGNPEIERLHHMLNDAKIPHNFTSNLFSGNQIVYFGRKGEPESVPGVIYGPGYGSVCSIIEDGMLLEISGLLTEAEKENDSVAGELTAEEVFRRIRCDWEADKNRGDNL